MSGRGRVHIRQADRSHAGRIHALITASLDEGRLLPRWFDDIVAHAGRFVIATRGRRIVGCAELAPLGPHVAEVRSLAVAAGARGSGLGARLVDEIARQARRAGFERLSAFTHAPRYFSRMGFSIVPHRWVPEKIATDCVGCAEFRRCGQLAMVMALDTAVDAVDSDRMAVRAL